MNRRKEKRGDDEGKIEEMKVKRKERKMRGGRTKEGKKIGGERNQRLDI